jgi:hypothetical protein
VLCHFLDIGTKEILLNRIFYQFYPNSFYNINLKYHANARVIIFFFHYGIGNDREFKDGDIIAGSVFCIFW